MIRTYDQKVADIAEVFVDDALNERLKRRSDLAPLTPEARAQLVHAVASAMGQAIEQEMDQIEQDLGLR